MKLEKIKIGNKNVMPFTIPSGIIVTEVSTLERIANEIPEIGILTTKSIGPRPRLVSEGDEVKNPDPNKEYGNREPILLQYAPYCFMNAVGLTNPGAEEFAKKLSTINFPDDKFLLASIFGKNSDEFVCVAKTLEDYVDGFELNLSCPHCEQIGMALGQDSSLVYEITRAVVSQTKKPVFAKLTPNVSNIGEIAKSAMSAGAYGITAINTAGPGYYSVDENPVLTNKVGGLSGIGIIPLGLKCVRDIRTAIGKNVPIIGMGGIRNATDVEAYASIGANFFGIGSALAGMTERDMKIYFPTLIEDLNNDTNNAENLLKLVDMNYKKFNIKEKIDSGDFHILKMDKSLEALAGQFVFAWLPEKGEKPFSVMDTEPLTIAFLERGYFTKELAKLNRGDSIYFRGPYGQEPKIPANSKIVLVGGGTGIAGIYLFAKQNNPIQIFIGAKNVNYIPLLKELTKFNNIHISTEDGSMGYRGLVTNLLKKYLKKGGYFINCGPTGMVNTAIEIEKRFTNPNKIFSSIEYMISCGVGICGKCANEKGLRTCVEGPFMQYK